MRLASSRAGYGPTKTRNSPLTWRTLGSTPIGRDLVRDVRDEILRIGKICKGAQLHDESAVLAARRAPPARRSPGARQGRPPRRPAGRPAAAVRRPRASGRPAGRIGLDFDFAAPLLRDPDPRRRCKGEIDHATMQERPAIVDADDHAFAAGDVGDARVGRQRQRGMRRGHRIHVVGLAGGRLFAVELAPVPRRDAALAIGPQDRGRHVVAAEHRIGPVGEAMQRLGSRNGVRDRVQIGRDAVAGAIILVVPGRGGWRRGRRRAPARSGSFGRCAAARDQRWRATAGGRNRQANAGSWSATSRRAYYSPTAGRPAGAMPRWRAVVAPLRCIRPRQGEHNLAKPNFGYQKRQKELEKKRKKEEKMKKKLEKSARPARGGARACAGRRGARLT